MMRFSLHRAVSLLAVVAIGVSGVFVGGCASGVGNRDIPEPTTQMPERTERVSVYFATGRSLNQEYRIVDADDVYVATLSELLAAQPEDPDVPVVQPVAEFRSVTLEDGLLTIDWDRGILDFEADPEEYTIAWGAFILTFGQFPEVERLAFTVEGQTNGELGGKDVEEFWGQVTLADQPWDIQRPPGFGDPGASDETTITEPLPEDGASGE